MRLAFLKFLEYHIQVVAPAKNRGNILPKTNFENEKNENR